MVDDWYNSKEYKRQLDSFLEGYRWLSDFRLDGYNYEMIFYIRPSDGNLDGDRCESMFIHKNNPYRGILLHD